MREFLIPIHVREEEELYSAFDPSGLTLSSSLTDYLVDYVEDRKPGETVRIDLIANAEINDGRFRESYDRLLRKLQDRNKRDMLKCNIRAARMMIIGILFILVGLISASQIREIPTVVISTIGSFSVWEASAECIEVLPSLLKKDRILRRMADARIMYTRSDIDK